jgi:predicted nucleic-acid-binding Zn-ribbon protein
MSWLVRETWYPEKTSATEIYSYFYESALNECCGGREPIIDKLQTFKGICNSYEEAKNYVQSHIADDGCGRIQYYAPVGTNKKAEDLMRRIRKEQESLLAYTREHSVTGQKAAYVSCPKCGSKLAREYLESRETGGYIKLEGDNVLSRKYVATFCPVCGEELISNTGRDVVARKRQKIKDLRDEYVQAKSKCKKEIRWYVYMQAYLG